MLWLSHRALLPEGAGSQKYKHQKEGLKENFTASSHKLSKNIRGLDQFQWIINDMAREFWSELRLKPFQSWKWRLLCAKKQKVYPVLVQWPSSSSGSLSFLLRSASKLFCVVNVCFALTGETEVSRKVWLFYNNHNKTSSFTVSYTELILKTGANAQVWPSMVWAWRCRIWARFWSDVWAARHVLESGRISASSGVVCDAAEQLPDQPTCPKFNDVRHTVEAEPRVDSPRSVAFLGTASAQNGQTERLKVLMWTENT